MGLVHSATISDGLTDVRERVLDLLRHGSVPDWLRADPKMKGSTTSVRYLNSQRDLAKDSANGAIARFYVFSPTWDSWPVPGSVAERVEAYLQGQTHTSHVESLDDGQFFKGVFVVADLTAEGQVQDVSLEALYWD